MSCAPAHPPWWFCSRLRQRCDVLLLLRGLQLLGREEQMVPCPADSAPAPPARVWLALSAEKHTVVE